MHGCCESKDAQVEAVLVVALVTSLLLAAAVVVVVVVVVVMVVVVIAVGEVVTLFIFCCDTFSIMICKQSVLKTLT